MNTNSYLTSESWLKTATAKLQKAGIATARLDCLVLLEDTTGEDRGWLLAHPEYALQGLALKGLSGMVERRARHEPLAYIRGKSEFYGREFLVSADTLQPRPESETIIDKLKELIQNLQKSHLLEDSPLTNGGNTGLSIVDVGTGSGCLAITAKLEFPEVEVLATDISAKCIKIAKQNAKKLGADVKFYTGDLLQPVGSILNQSAIGISHASAEAVLSSRNGRKRTRGTLSEYRRGKTASVPQGIGRVLSSAQKQDNAGAIVLVANLPYVPDSQTVNEAAMFEPRLAIFGGRDGLDLYRRLFDQVKDLPAPPQYVLTESLPFQHKKLAKIAKSAGYRLEKTDDFVQMFSFEGRPQA